MWGRWVLLAIYIIWTAFSLIDIKRNWNDIDVDYLSTVVWQFIHALALVFGFVIFIACCIIYF